MNRPVALLAASLLLAGLPLGLPLGMAAQTAQAQSVSPDFVDDQITLNVAVEDWVKTETARVTLRIDAAGGGDAKATGAAGLRPDLIKAAKAVADKADWRITTLDQQEDSAGLERWQALLETRLPEAALAGLEGRAKGASRPGLQVRIAEVAFQPTLAEFETTRSQLRQQIYDRVTAELGRLKAAFPGRDFRLGRIDFGEDSQPQPMMAQRMMDASEKSVGAGPVQSGVADRLTLTARVTLSAFSLSAAQK
jgi:hypothetical protein